MAGAGYKLFNTGDVLTAAQVNTYLQEQAVMRFANATARTTALSGVLAEGMMSYLDDTNSVEVYNGSAWVSVGSTGDITAVTAGTGISGGGTSGDVTITNSMATAIDAKGDLVVGTGADAFSRLAVGANNTVLTADSSTATGLKWATSSPSFVGCLAYNDTFSFTFTSGVAAAIAFPNEYFDTDNFHSTSSNTSRITIPSGKAGKYLITANIDQNGVSGYFICSVRQYNSGGTQINALGLNRQFSQNPGGNNFAGGTQTILADAAVGDYFEMYWQWGQASATVVNQYARLSAIYLGA